MSSQEVKHVLNQLLTDEDFRRQFHGDPEATLQDLDLTDHEKTMLADLNISDVEESDLVVAHLMDQSAIRVGSVYIT
ncbi:MAG: Os1348 family NHLP clan protein [Actinomycetota bacterium]|nr:Os1348 family NHLP clan protein [Actinomycetota bacterium]